MTKRTKTPQRKLSSYGTTRIVIEMTQKGGGRQKADPLTTNAKPSRQDGECPGPEGCTLREEQTAVILRRNVPRMIGL